MSADDEPPKSSTSEPAQVEAPAKSQSDTPIPPQDHAPNTDDRSALLTQARAFLASPQIQHQDDLAKRKFLMEKGLNPDEVDTLMHEFIPPVPPRYYPQPAPSNLPNLLLGLARLAAWLMGSSAFLFVIFSRLILPRLTQTSNARRSLQLHHLGLLERLNTSIKSLKATQNEAFSVLPKPTRPTEDPKYEDFHSLDELQLSADVPLEVPEYTLLRCAIEGLAAQEKKVETEELFEVLQQRYPWLKTDEGLQYRNSLWETLTTNPSFPLIDDGGHLVWTYQPPIIPLPQPSNDPLLSSLTSLKYALPPPRQPGDSVSSSAFQHTLQALTDFTGYITTQTYSLTSSSFRLPGMGLSPALSPQEEDIRKDIRALKGLVLNRRSFVTSPHRVESQSDMSNVPS
ncbi:hypothetical protein BD410DRAFT_11556 [Rickenella mellea]|uniref:Peroxisome membrane anchor protein Pex14p N-terminal domain-containing protein n=1 Tax=Rickenella mellea TaxID=50990 RepID=A0A4R5XDU7_9AGAM|nr:hypothetical protein BD410DRAFT_11556 [Rickenella mellea]